MRGRRRHGEAWRIAIRISDRDLASRWCVFVRHYRRSCGHRSVVDRIHRHRHLHRGGAALAVIHRHDEGITAVVVGVGNVFKRAIRLDGHRAMRWRSRHHIGQRIAIGVLGGDLAANRLVFICDHGVHTGRWHLIVRATGLARWRHGHRHFHGRSATLAVIHRDGKGVIAVVARVGRVFKRAIRLDGHRAMRRWLGDGEGWRIAVRITHCDLATGGRIFGGSHGVGARARRVVDRSHGHRHFHRGGSTIAVIHRHSEAIPAAVAGIGRVFEAAVRAQRYRAMRWRCGHCQRRRVAIRIVNRDLAAHRCVFTRGDGVGAGRGCIVHGVHSHRHSYRCQTALAVIYGDGKAVFAVVVGVGRIGVTAIGVERHRAVLGAAGHDVAQLIAIGVRAHNAPAHGLIFIGHHRIGAGHRGFVVRSTGVLRRHQDRHFHGRRAAVAVIHRHSEAVTAAEALVGRVNE